ncbi:radical SAM protein [Streptomyces clavifer]|uniref:radical SAM protein n=1 Tax=Streptomyces clavifer TaxID=68188 RepID=UPI0033226207
MRDRTFRRPSGEEDSFPERRSTGIALPVSCILKISSRCNLDCTYCYIYNKGDTTHLTRPRVMSLEVARAAIREITEYASRNGIAEAVVALHGGEPLLVGKPWMTRFLDDVRKMTPADVRLSFTLQSNGVLIDADWLSLFASHGVQVGVSLDGPAVWNDRHRVNHQGKGSYSRVRKAIDLLVAQGAESPPWGILVVADPRFPGTEVFRHLLDIGVRNMDFLWPDYHHEEGPPWNADLLGRYYVDLFDEWYGNADPGVRVRWFESLLQLILGGESQISALGAQPVTDVVVETDGSLEPLDMLRICGDGMTLTGLDVRRHPIERLRETELYRMGLKNQELLPHDCLRCPVYGLCGGGEMPHRWSKKNAFSNPSVHCESLLAVIEHIVGTVRKEISFHAVTPRSNDAVAQSISG